MEKKNEPKLYHIEEMEEYLNSILPDSSNSFKYLYLKKQIMAHFSLARNGYTNRISSYTEAKREALDKLCCKIAEEYGTTEKHGLNWRRKMTLISRQFNIILKNTTKSIQAIFLKNLIE